MDKASSAGVVADPGARHQRSLLERSCGNEGVGAAMRKIAVNKVKCQIQVHDQAGLRIL